MQKAIYEFEAEEIKIIPIGDLHIGAEGSYYKEALKFLDAVPEAKIIFLGDLIDNAVIGSLGDVYTQSENPHEALQIVQGIFEKYQERILGVVGGNHERRTKRRVGIDPLKIICESFKIPYSDNLLVIDISLKQEGKKGRGSRNRVNYIIAVQHGMAGGRFPEKSQRQGRYFKGFFENADIYITGHTHVPDSFPSAIYGYDPRNKRIYKRTARFVVVPAWVDENYARVGMYPPSASSKQIIKLYASYKKKIKFDTVDEELIQSVL